MLFYMLKVLLKMFRNLFQSVLVISFIVQHVLVLENIGTMFYNPTPGTWRKRYLSERNFKLH